MRNRSSKIPGFTAFVTLNKASVHYRSIGSPVQISHSVIPAVWKIQGCDLVWDGATGQTEQRCYTDWNFRPSVPLSGCPGADRSGALCYPFCAEGYDGVGPVCWQRCPEGYTDDGATCRRDAHITSADNSRCPWYDKCGLTLARGCSTCPPGYDNDGCTCRRDPDIFAKDSYGRGVGGPMSCHAGEEQIGGLCYRNCPAGYVADGIICNAIMQTCENVLVTIPPDYSQLQRFCFARFNPDSQVEPCTPIHIMADTEEHARQAVQCTCQNCAFNRVDCSALDAGRACP